MVLEVQAVRQVLADRQLSILFTGQWTRQCLVGMSTQLACQHSFGVSDSDQLMAFGRLAGQPIKELAVHGERTPSHP